MGGPEVVTVNDMYKLKDVFAHIGASITAALECKLEKAPENTALYHFKKAKKWQKVAIALKKHVFKNAFTMKEFKKILVVHFKAEIMSDISYLSDVGFKYHTHHITKKEYATLLDSEFCKWIDDDKYFEHTDMGKKSKGLKC